jgi:hypothetical protein
MRSVIRHIITALIAVAIIVGSCTGRRSKTEHRNLIQEKDLIRILTDVYMADGLLSLPEINYKYSTGDTLESYIEIIEGYGYTKPDMDKTMKYYFIKKPKELVKIYDKVLGNLSEMESMVDKELPGAGIREMNIWPGKPFYSYPGQTPEDIDGLDLLFRHKGPVNFKFTITIFPDDQSADLRPGLFFSHTDSAGIEQKVVFSNVRYLKDGQPHTYSFNLVQNLPDPVRLKGWFINREGISPDREMHFMVGNIIMLRY